MASWYARARTVIARARSRAWTAASQPPWNWRPARTVHSPGKILTDLAVALALGGDCLSDVAMPRCEPSCSDWSLLTRWSPGWWPAGQLMLPPR